MFQNSFGVLGFHEFRVGGLRGAAWLTLAAVRLMAVITTQGSG